MTESSYLTRIGTLIRDARRHQGLTQNELADKLGTSQSAVARIEQGRQNLSLEMLARVGETLGSEFVSLGHSGPQHLRIVGGKKLSGSIPVKTSKNAAVALLCASLLNKGRTTLRSLARIEEVNRIIEVLTSIGVKVRWLPDSNDLEIIPPARLDLDSIDVAAARRTRTVIMFFGPLLHELDSFQLPYAGGVRPRDAHHRAAPVGAAPVRSRCRCHTRLLRGTGGGCPQPGAGHRADRAG